MKKPLSGRSVLCRFARARVKRQSQSAAKTPLKKTRLSSKRMVARPWWASRRAGVLSYELTKWCDFLIGEHTVESRAVCRRGFASATWTLGFQASTSAGARVAADSFAGATRRQRGGLRNGLLRWSKAFWLRRLNNLADNVLLRVTFLPMERRCPRHEATHSGLLVSPPAPRADGGGGKAESDLF